MVLSITRGLASGLLIPVWLSVACSQPASSGSAALDGAEEWFTDRAVASGLDFVHFNGMTGDFLFAEVIPPGVALLDYDNDNDLDIFVPQGQMLGDKPLSAALRQPHGSLRSRLFRNDLEIGADGTRVLRFTDATEASGIDVRGYAMGAAAGDIDNDGCVDLYVTSLDRSQLFRNECNGTFTDVSKTSGAESAGWSVSAAFVDYDRDGWLDLYVAHYVHYDAATDRPCLHPIGRLVDYCPPNVYRPQADVLFHNNRDGTFTDVTAASGMGREFGPALGVSTADVNGDGWVDIYVANDGAANQLWINGGDGTFTNTALLAGAALGADGEAKGSMGVDWGDFDRDGDEDLFITELAREGHDLYVNDGSGVFEERAASAGMRLPSLPHTGFGAAWLDFDNDGWLDMLTVNGGVRHTAEALTRHETFALHQPKQLFRNLGQGQFEDVTAKAGAIFSRPEVSRGAAFGDLDNDGDTDVVVANNSGPVQLLINEVGNTRHWVGLRVRVGARVGVVPATGPTLWRRARADGSYASANDPRVLVGLGDTAAIPKVIVQWPSGRVEAWTDVPVDRYSTLREGEGR